MSLSVRHLSLFDFGYSHQRCWRLVLCVATNILMALQSFRVLPATCHSHQHSDGTTVLQCCQLPAIATNILMALQSFRVLPATCWMTHPHIPENPKLQVRSLRLVEARSFIYVAAVLIMKRQFMYSHSQIKVHLVSCTHTVVFNWACCNKCAATWQVVPFLLLYPAPHWFTENYL